MYKYSAKKNAFYLADNEDIYKSAGTWPDDVIDIETQIAESFMVTPPPGRQRIAGDDGLPAWGDIPPPTRDELVAFAINEKQQRIDVANAYMNSKQWPGKAALSRLKGDELAQYNVWLDYLDALESVDASTAPDNWPEMPS